MSTYAPALNDWLTARTLEWAAKKGVDVELSTASYTEIQPKILTGVDTHNPPDIAFGAGGLVALLAEDANSRSLVELDDVLNEIGKDDLITPCKKWYTMGGKQYGIDLFLFVDVVHMIKKFLNESGRTTDELKTWADYIQFAKEVKARHPDMYPVGHTLGMTFDGTESWYQHSWPMGGGLTTSRSSSGVIFNSAENRAALQEVIDMYDAGLISPNMIQADEMLNNNAYLSQSAAFICEGPTPFYAAVTRNPALAADTILLPSPTGPKGFFSYGSKQAMVVFKEAKNVDLAKDLLVYIFKNKDAYLTFIKNGFYAPYPVFKSVQEKLKADAVQGPIWSSYIGIEPSIIDYTYPLSEPSKACDEVDAKYLEAQTFTDVLINKKPVDTTIADIEVKMKDIFKRVYGQ
jgi:multiple sugar transport system substrate-binding protein